MTLRLWLLLGILAAQFPQPAGPSPPGARATITGKVIRADTSQPVTGARVRIRQTGAVRPVDDAGNFSFFVAPGRYTLTVEREGLILQEDPKNAITPAGKMLTIRAEQKFGNVILPMVGAPTISGYTYSPCGEPLAGAAVHAYRWRFTPTGPKLRIARTALTNDLGEFRFFGLGFGDYAVSATYNKRAQRAALFGARLSANVTDPDDGYTTVFYGGGTSPFQARSIRVAPGIDSGTLNIAFGEIPRLRVRGRVVSAGALPADLKIVFVPEGTDVLLENSGVAISAGSDGAFEITGVSPGAYVILAYGTGQSSEVVPVYVANDDVEKLSVPLFSTVTVPGRVATDSRSDVQGMRVSLIRSDSEIEQRFDGFTAADGTFTIPEVGRGEYDVYIERLPAGSHIRSVRWGGGDVLATGLRLGFLITRDGIPRLDITTSSAGAMVEGRVTDRAGEPAGGIQVVLVPDDNFRRRADRYILGYTDVAGSFQLDGAPPGRYTAYAFEQLEPGAYYAFGYNSQLSRRFADRAAPVNLNDAKSTSIELKAIPAAETTGGFR
jgi:hypothetical protein